MQAPKSDIPSDLPSELLVPDFASMVGTENYKIIQALKPTLKKWNEGYYDYLTRLRITNGKRNVNKRNGGMRGGMHDNNAPDYTTVDVTDEDYETFKCDYFKRKFDDFKLLMDIGTKNTKY
jgi:hypothetical protein